MGAFFVNFVTFTSAPIYTYINIRSLKIILFSLSHKLNILYVQKTLSLDIIVVSLLKYYTSIPPTYSELWESHFFLLLLFSKVTSDTIPILTLVFNKHIMMINQIDTGILLHLQLQL